MTTTAMRRRVVRPADLAAALQIAARIVARDGADYLPIFLRLEAEARAGEAEAEAMARALAHSGRAA